ncbi:MAG: hypothetical protein Q8P61_06120 [Candidatus Nanopelagicales bacterium]|nr:hypothetical protein [Candidatus Nanopelagicales bacterium]
MKAPGDDPQVGGSGGAISRWLYSNKNLAGCGLALAAPVLAVAGLVAPPVALALLPVLYAAGALAAPGNPQVDLVSGLDPGDVKRSLKTIRSKVEGRVNRSVSERVNQICTLVEELLPRVREFGSGSREMHILVRTATDYLPATLEPYLALPRFYAEHKAVSQGQTATQILCDQLDIMIDRLEQIGEALARSDSDKLLANGRFLADKFGHEGIDLPAAPPAPGDRGDLPADGSDKPQ